MHLARLSDAAAEADVADRPHRAAAARVLAIDVRVERHVDVLVEHVDRGRSTRARRVELPAIVRQRGLVSNSSRGGREEASNDEDCDETHEVRNGAFGAWTFLKGPVTLWETAYEMS